MFTRGRYLLRLFGLVVVVSRSSCALEGIVSGEVAVETREEGAWTYRPDRCFSGERQSFFGVDLVEGDALAGRITRIVDEPVEGARVVVNVPDAEIARVFDGEGCARFDVVIERQNSRVNEIWDIDGYADILCEERGGALRMNVVFESCH
jgi:hypothetical protein